MPHQPTAPRLDIYAPIHRALRLFMTDTLARVGALDVADPREVATVLEQLDALLELCRHHALVENHLVHPAIEAAQPGASQRIDGDHVHHFEAIAALQAEAAALRALPRGPAALRLYRQLALFVAENFVHMHAEETLHNQVLWAGYDDAAIAQLEQRIVTESGPEQRALVLRWMTPALPPSERAARFVAMRASMPPEAFVNLLDAARAALDGRGWVKLSASLARPQSLPA
ncbi:MAG TPA: hypothetical protein VFU71_20115 [Burkholderiaceae bacterium]|nr:hypothetical protein [Burkholderiaceae bacterium]